MAGAAAGGAERSPRPRAHVENIKRYFLAPLPVEERDRFAENLCILSHAARDMLPRLP